MSELRDILALAFGGPVESEDGETLGFETHASASERQIADCEVRLGTRIPTELRDLLLFTNGASLYGCRIMSLDELHFFPVQGLIAFHDWGNGDFDCIATSTSEYAEGEVVFMNHSPDVTVRVAGSLAEWIAQVISEIKREGVLLHPADYRMRRGKSEGVYGRVLTALKDIDCELNR